MFGDRFIRSAAIALEVYGVLGLFIAAAMLVVGYSTFSQVARLQRTLESERAALVSSIRAASATVRDTATATADFQHSINTARGAANQASSMANDSAGTFRTLGASVKSLTIFGIQPLGNLGPQFDQSADQLQQLAISLGSTRDALGQNNADVQRVGTDLNRLQGQLDDVAASLGQPDLLGLGTQSLLPFQLAFYGMCLLVIMQSAFSVIAGLALLNAQRATRNATRETLERPPPVPSSQTVSFERADQLRDVS